MARTPALTRLERVAALGRSASARGISIEAAEEQRRPVTVAEREPLVPGGVELLDRPGGGDLLPQPVAGTLPGVGPGNPLGAVLVTGQLAQLAQ